MTAPAPTVCPTCKGERFVDYVGYDADNDSTVEYDRPCPDCCCSTYGEPTSTPPLCERHQRENDDHDAAKAWREGRYE